MVQGLSDANLGEAAIGTTLHNWREPSKDFDSTYNSGLFTVTNARFVVQSGMLKIDGESSGQGNPKTRPCFQDHFWFYHKSSKRFYDPSYGISLSEAESDFKIYIGKYITSVINSIKSSSSLKTTDIYKYLLGNNQTLWKGK